MKAVYARRLTADDLDEVYRVFDTRSTLMKIPLTAEKRKEHKAYAEAHITSQNDFTCYWGAFNEQDKLCSYLVQEFSILYPRWYIKVLVTEDTFSLKPLSMRGSGLGLCIDRAIEAAEYAEYFEWLYAVVPDRFSTRAKIWTTQSESVSRYIFVVDSVVKENDIPKFTYQQRLIGNNVTRNKPWIIKKAVLKPEYRFKILNNHGKLDLTYKDAYDE